MAFHLGDLIAIGFTPASGADFRLRQAEKGLGL